MTTDVQKAKILAPITITPAMLTACAVAEPDIAMGEVAWNAATNYSIGDEVIRTATHRVYTALADGVDSGNPEDTPLRWRDSRPTNLWAAFDVYRSTAIKYEGTLTMTVEPGIIIDMDFRGLVGDSINVTLKNAVSDVEYFNEDYSLSLYVTGDLEWAFWFETPGQQDSLRVRAPYPDDAKVEITLTPSTATGMSEIGIWAMGAFKTIGVPLHGFRAKPVNYSTIKLDTNGDLYIKPGYTAKDLSGTCWLDSESEAQQVCDVINRLLSTPVSIVISDMAGYDYLNTFGLVSAEIIAADVDHATMNIEARGIV